MHDIDKHFRKLNKHKQNKPLKKFRGDEGEAGTKLDPYKREKIDLRDIDDLIEDEELNDDEQTDEDSD